MTGDQVKILREQAGLTQVELAKSLGISQAEVSHIENQRRGLTGSVARALGAVLECDIPEMDEDCADRISLMRKIPNLTPEQCRAFNTILGQVKERVSKAGANSSPNKPHAGSFGGKE